MDQLNFNLALYLIVGISSQKTIRFPNPAIVKYVTIRSGVTGYTPVYFSWDAYQGSTISWDNTLNNGVLFVVRSQNDLLPYYPLNIAANSLYIDNQGTASSVSINIIYRFLTEEEKKLL